jgi:hypothetical protein
MKLPISPNGARDRPSSGCLAAAVRPDTQSDASAHAAWWPAGECTTEGRPRVPAGAGRARWCCVTHLCHCRPSSRRTRTVTQRVPRAREWLESGKTHRTALGRREPRTAVPQREGTQAGRSPGLEAHPEAGHIVLLDVARCAAVTGLLGCKPARTPNVLTGGEEAQRLARRRRTYAHRHVSELFVLGLRMRRVLAGWGTDAGKGVRAHRAAAATGMMRQNAGPRASPSAKVSTLDAAAHVCCFCSA